MADAPPRSPLPAFRGDLSEQQLLDRGARRRADFMRAAEEHADSDLNFTNFMRRGYNKAPLVRVPPANETAYQQELEAFRRATEPVPPAPQRLKRPVGAARPPTAPTPRVSRARRRPPAGARRVSGRRVRRVGPARTRRRLSGRRERWTTCARPAPRPPPCGGHVCRAARGAEGAAGRGRVYMEDPSFDPKAEEEAFFAREKARAEGRYWDSEVGRQRHLHTGVST